MSDDLPHVLGELGDISIEEVQPAMKPLSFVVESHEYPGFLSQCRFNTVSTVTPIYSR